MRERYRELSFYSHRLQVRVEGFRLERLLEKGMKAGLNIKGVHLYSETEMVCTVSKEDFKALKKLGRSLYKFTVISERGPVVSLWSFLRKPALIIGCLLTCAFVVIESLVVQSIEVNGYKAIPEVELLQVLEEEGIYKGAFRPEINWEKAEKAIYDVFPQVTWVQLAYSGRLVVLNISETDHDIYEKGVQNYPQEQEGGLQDTEDLMYTDIVATRSGYIESIAPYYGLAMVEKGDYVKKGDILIAGCVPIEPTTFAEDDPKEYYVNAMGEVWAKTPYHLKFNQERYVLAENLPSSKTDGQMVINRVEKTKEQIEKKVEQQIRLWAKENLPEKAEILKKSLKFSTKENIIEVSVTLEVSQQIGKPQEERIGENTTDTQSDRQD